jgi:hypothetical protein
MIALPVNHQMSNGGNMLTLTEIQERLWDRRIGVVADATGINRKTLWAIVSGRTKNPSYEVIKKLSDYFKENN